MASRTSANVGVMVFVAVLSLLVLTFFVFAVIFFARTQRLTADLEQARQDLSVAVKVRGDRWEELRSEAGGEGVVDHLDDSLRTAMRMITGARRDTLESFQEKVQSRVGADVDLASTSLLEVLEDKNQRIDQLQNQLTASERARDNARADLQAEIDRTNELKAEHRRTIESLNAEIGGYKQELDTLHARVDEGSTWIEDQVARIQQEADAQLASLEGRNRELEDRILIVEEQLRNCQAQYASDRPSGTFEGALVDGRVVGINPLANEVYVDRGRKDHIVLGMTFEVYANSSAIRPDDQGNYPPGKATVEITRIEDNTSFARILRESRGNPVVEGDVIANAVYDPNKVYTFTVFGNFDTNGDGVSTPQEIQDIRGMIENWGGVTTDEVTGRTDFLVLGDRPILPPQPSPDAPIEVIQQYLALRRSVDRYDQLFETAQQTGIPVLNQNRLYTLTGLYARQ